MDSGREAMWVERMELVSRWEQSGLSMAAFCRREGIAYWKFLSWRKRSAQTTDAPGGFAELVVRNGDKQEVEKTAVEQRALVEIALPGGACVRVFAGADAALLRDVVQAARAC